jgi:preprotein translocase subunit SecF
MLIFLTLLVMLAYVTIRFKAQYGIGLVLGIMHDGLVVVAFVIWSGMEFSTTTIAAVLTILGYSTNNTIVVYDRIRENRRIYPEHPFVDVMNISLTNVLARTIILSLTTMLAVFFLFLFARGSMRDFALALMVGLVSGVYTTLFIASGFVNFFEDMKIKREKKKLAVAV